MQRVLDIDLDFFVHGVACYRDPLAGRLDAGDYPPWTSDDATSFLREQCLLDHPVPGFAVEHHGEVFGRWKALIEAGSLRPPFHVTHVDAHADLSMGEIGYHYLLTELVHMPICERSDAALQKAGDGDYLAFAIGCRWVRDLAYVYNAGGGSDVHPYLWADFDRFSGSIRLAALTGADINTLLNGLRPAVSYLEPAVPITVARGESFQAAEAFDLVSLARSPAFTPPEADPVYEAIRTALSDEASLR